LRYVAANRIIRAVITLVSITSLFGWSYSVLMPIFARDVLKIGAKGYGYLLAANGVGAFFGAITLASLGNYPHRRRLVFGGLFGFCVTVTVFALSRNAWLSAAALAGVGWFMIIFFATANTSVQLRTPDELRGRVMGIYALAFLGLNPFGSMLAGSIAHAAGASVAITLGAAVCVVAAIIVARLVPPEQSRPSQQPHD
jgi:predicted MFS family arabinose efflux permease